MLAVVENFNLICIHFCKHHHLFYSVILLDVDRPNYYQTSSELSIFTFTVLIILELNPENDRCIFVDQKYMH